MDRPISRTRFRHHRPQSPPDARDGRPRLHLWAIAGSCRKLPPLLGCKNGEELIGLVQKAVGGRLRVTGNPRMIDAAEDENHGGRDDDAARAKELERTLGDDRIVAVVALRGGSWLTRILPRVDFSVLGRRRQPLAVFGFSELSTVINLVARYPRVRAFYDMGPAFLRVGLADAARARGLKSRSRRADPASTDAFVGQRIIPEFSAFFEDVMRIVEGSGSRRPIRAHRIHGRLPGGCTARFVGGTLSVLTPLVGTPYSPALDPRGRWLMVEDINEAPHRVDRALAHLRLAGLLQRYEGFLVGDFHDDQGDRVLAVVELLRHHLGKSARQPILVTGDVGHVWPMAPLPMGIPVRINSVSPARSGHYELLIPWNRLATLGNAG